MTIQELAERFKNQMEWKKRDDGSEFVKRKENADENLHTLIRNVHDGMLPDDWIYSEIWESLAEIADSDDENLEYPEKEPDVYNTDLIDWLKDDLYRIDDVNDAIREGFNNIIGAIGVAQQRAKEEIYFSVLNELKNFIDEYDDESENEDEEEE